MIFSLSSSIPTRLIQQQRGNVRAQKVLNKTSSAQFATQPLVKPVPVFDLCAPSSNDVPVLLLNQPTILVTALQLCASMHNSICCAMVLSFSNLVTKVDTENATYHCFLLRKHLHTCSSAKNKFTDQIYFTNGSKVFFFQDEVGPFHLIHTKLCQRSTFLSLNAFPFSFLRFSVVSLMMIKIINKVSL